MNGVKANGTVHNVDDKKPDEDVDAIALEAIKRVKRKRQHAKIVMNYEDEDDQNNQDGDTDEQQQKENLDEDIKAAGKLQRLNKAVMAGDMTKFLKLIDQKLGINQADSFGRTPVQNAILKSDTRMVETLLGSGADVGHQDDRGDAPLHYAVRSGSETILKLVLGNCSEVNTKGSNGCTPLHIAATLNKPKLCKLLIENHADVNSTDIDGKTPLGKAMESGAAKSAEFLLEYIKNNHLKLDSFLSDADNEGNTLLHLAVDSGFTRVVELCLDNGSIIRRPKRNDRSTAFHLACEQGATEIVQLFLEKDPNLAKILLVDANGTTPLHKAAQTNNHSILHLLITKGANINARNNDNVTPLMMAASRGSKDCVRMLMENGADTTVKDVDGRTAVFNAVGYGVTMEILLEDQALVPLLTEKDASGYAPPHYAAQQGDLKSIQLFLDHNKSTATILSDFQDTPLHVAARYGWHEVVRALLDKQGAKIVNLQDNRSRTALHYACAGGHHKVAAVLLGFGAEIEKDQSSRTALHEAAKKGSKKTVEKILSTHPRCLNNFDDDKNTALHVAAYHGHAHLVKYLLSVEGQEILMNSSGQNVFDLAVDMDLREVAQAIAEHDRWREVMESCKSGVPRQMTTLIEKMPLVAECIFDQCVSTEGDIMNKDYKVTYDLSVALIKSDLKGTKQRTTLSIMERLAQLRVVRLLRHRITFTILSQKWNTFGWVFFLLNAVLFLLYLLPLTYLHVALRDNDAKYCAAYNTSAQSEKGCDRNFLEMQILQIYVAVMTGVLLLKELYQFYLQWRTYFLQFTNLLELSAYIAALLSVIPSCECKWGRQKTAAVVALFFGWINLILYIQRLPAYGKYIIMLYKMFMTLLKVLLLFVLFVVSFGLCFYLMIYSDDFTDLPNTLMEMFIMTLGELNYGDKFRPWANLSYPYLINILFFLFALTMPIILMNMLVGLSVGDIDAIEQSALIDRYVMQIELMSYIENIIPRFILRRVTSYKRVEYPNHGASVLSKIFNSVIGFGEYEAPDDEDGDEQGVVIATMNDKLEDHSHEIQEMHDVIKQMYQMLKDSKKRE
ncbi:transient receptor potential cation channel subfamily A member 1 isoform X2 [Nematostella vectensis]|uniref:transient receptor potential cation channel subfamily A member 1 isoform X2 n=1 Tax=Nematostella vectensis TaxID=45351 RepID=UPI0020774220|nr:transient receptor potential cation channel subfamily A member 1 isoform X2 [Nematostella vectensis]